MAGLSVFADAVFLVATKCQSWSMRTAGLGVTLRALLPSAGGFPDHVQVCPVVVIQSHRQGIEILSLQIGHECAYNGTFQGSHLGKGVGEQKR